MRLRESKIVPFILIIPLLLVAFFRCQKLPESADEIKNEKDVAMFLDQLEKRYEKTCVNMGQVYWNFYTGDETADPIAVRTEFDNILLNTVYRNIISQWRYGQDKEISPELMRRLEIWTQCFLGAYVEQEEEIYALEHMLEERNQQFQFVMEGKEVTRAELNHITRTDPNPERRRKAWEAFGLLSEANEADLLRLMYLRNEKIGPVREQMDYWTFSLMVQAINAGWLEKLIDRFEEQTREPYRRFIYSMKERLGIDTLYPWDIQYGLGQLTSLPDRYFPKDRAMPTLDDFLKAIGFDTDTLPIQVVDRKISYGAYGFAIAIPDDFRLMVNPSQGYHYYSKLFHEYGRGLYKVHIQATHPILKGYEWVSGATSSAYSEGMAEVLAEFTRDPSWLKKYTHLRDDQIQSYVNARVTLDLYNIRSLMSTISFELLAYKDLSQNLDQLQKELDRTFLLTDIPEDSPSRWASMTSLVTYPIYHQNYLLATVVANQVHQTLKEQFGTRTIDNPEVGRWLIDNLYAPGESLPWRERIRRATGAWPDIDAYINRLVGQKTASHGS